MVSKIIGTVTPWITVPDGIYRGAMQPRLPREQETLKLIAPTEAGAMKLARSLVLRP
jgi:hypothetical protein